MSTTISGARGVITLGKKIVSASGTCRAFSPSYHQFPSNVTQNDIQLLSSFSILTAMKTSSSTADASTIGSRNVSKLSSGIILDEPLRCQGVDLLKVILTITTGLIVGAWISKNTANFLEKTELFISDDDDDDVDDNGD